MRAILVLSLWALTVASHHLDHNEAVNNPNTISKAGGSFDPNNYLHLLGLKRGPDEEPLPPLEDDEDDDLDIPKTFDAREKWKSCISLQEVRDQGNCGSCWAVSAASALTDRFCIATKTKFNGHLSAQDLTSCSNEFCDYGCQGGSDFGAWRYFQDTGICTGGDYHSGEGCQPYLIPPSELNNSGHIKNCSSYGVVATPPCQNICYNMKYKYRSKYQDLYRVKSLFTIQKDIKKTQKEIYKHGPVQASFDVYEDFRNYKKGVYIQKSYKLLGGHAVKIIGWGTEDGTDYWLVANSWGAKWGDKGFFKIRRGTNECGIENDINGGVPAV